MSEKKPYRRCFVPLCTNTEINSPNKIFFIVPRDKKRCKAWFNMAHRNDKPANRLYYCSEDHFNLKEDMENYSMYCMMGGYRKLKINVMPHIFKCHKNRPVIEFSLNRSAAIKLNRKRIINEMLEEDRIKSNLNNAESKKRKCNMQRSILADVQNIIVDEIPDVSDRVTAEMINEIREPIEDVQKIAEESTCEVGVQSSEKKDDFINVNDGAGSSTYVDINLARFGTEGSSQIRNRIFLYQKSKVISKREKQIEHFRSKGTLTKPDLLTVSCQTEKIMVDKKLSPIKLPSQTSSSSFDSKTHLKSSSSATTTNSEYEISTDGKNEMEAEEHLEMKRLSLKIINYFISIDTKGYIGIPNEWIWILDDLSIFTHTPILHIKLVLVKIKKNDTFQRLAHSFGLSISAAKHNFHKAVHKIAHALRTLMYCPDKLALKKALPIPFRCNFSNVIGIIDCFEIQIEKPSHSVHQGLTWSEYKKCNTLKYLLCISPDGFVIFISSGYGGRVSDTVLFEDCEIMKILPENSLLMADRGFKQIQTILDKKNIQLVRPPSVFSGKKCTKQEVLLTKRIASLRIHVERVIRRIREFSLLQPHSTIDRHAISYIDSAVAIAAALINLQKPIINS